MGSRNCSRAPNTSKDSFAAVTMREIEMSRNVDKVETVVSRIEDANTVNIKGRKDDLAIGSRSCSCESAAVRFEGGFESEMSRNVDKPETVVNRIEDSNTIGNIGRKDDLAIGSRNCCSEFAGATHLCRNVDKAKTVVSKIEDANTSGAPGRKDDLAIGSWSCCCEPATC